MAAEDLEKVNMHQAKTHLSKLVERAEAGEEIVISRAGKPAAKLVPVAEKRPGKRTLGILEGQMDVPSEEEWADMDREVVQLFEESEIFPREDEIWKGD